jgi:hypothetical protein
VDVGKEQGAEPIAPRSPDTEAEFELRSSFSMLGPTKGMGHPSPPPSLANAALKGERATAAPRGWLGGPHNQFCRIRRTERSYADLGAREPKSFSWWRSLATNQRKFLVPPMSETIRMTVDARYRTRWPSDVRIDVVHRKDKSGPVKFFASRRIHEAQATRERRSRRVAVCSIRFGSREAADGSIRPEAHLYD